MSRVTDFCLRYFYQGSMNLSNDIPVAPAPLFIYSYAASLS